MAGSHRAYPDLLSNLRSVDMVTYDRVLQRPSLNCDALLELSNDARDALALHGAMGESMSKKVADFLRAAAKDEAYDILTIDLPTIMTCRLDKLLAEMVTHPMADAPNGNPWEDMAPAKRLLRQWRARFRERYFDIDQTRYHNLAKTGLLRDVVFDQGAMDDDQLWRAKSCEVLSESEGNLQFEAG